MKTMSPQSMRSVTRYFQDVSGIQLGEAKHALVVSRLQKLAVEAGAANIDAYVDAVVNSRAPAADAERCKLVDRLTTNETYFFREPQHFNHLAGRVETLPAGADFKVWSAASSSGEEAYSIAMLLTDKLGTRAWRVHGTDLSTAMVDSARRALYPIDRARMVPPDYLKRYCLKGQGAHEGQLLIERSLRDRVEFGVANLMQPLPALPMFDVIFLRNVLIYFDNPAKTEIVRRVLTQLKPDGLLYTGHAESLAALGLPVRMLTTAVHTHA